jgi:hypothetical protein
MAQERNLLRHSFENWLLLTHQRIALRDEARTSVAVVSDIARDQIHHGTSGRQRLLLIFD